MLHPTDFFDLSDPLAASLFEGCMYAWEPLSRTGAHIARLVGEGQTVRGEIMTGAHLGTAPVHIEEGDQTPVRIRVEMTNSAGVFQVDQLLRRKLAGSGLEEHIQVEAHIEGETEKRLVTRFRL